MHTPHLFDQTHRRLLDWIGFGRRAVVASALTLCLAQASPAALQDGTGGTGILLEDDFSFLASSYTPNNPLPSGWDVDTTGGGKLVYAYQLDFRMVDASATDRVIMRRTFVRQVDGKVTLEFRFKLPVKTDGVGFQLLDGTTLGLSLLTSGGNLCYENSSGVATTLQSYTANQEYGIKAICDLATDTATIMVDGIVRATNVPLRNAVAGLDRVCFQTAVAGTGDLYVGAVRVHKGFPAWEKFLTTAVGNVPADWTLTTTGGTASVQDYHSTTRPDTRSICLTDTVNAAGASVVLKKPMSTVTDKLSFEFKFLLPAQMDAMSFELRYANNIVVQIRTTSTDIGYINAAGMFVQLQASYRTNFWYHVKVVVDPAVYTSDIYLNGRKLATAAPNRNMISGIDEIAFVTPSTATGTVWIDDIILKKVEADPGDYPSAPAAGDFSPGYTVGVQSCSLWREGHHLGWDRINPWVQRKPLLGWYDEGSREVVDWELKWMAEHGIDYQMYCWFRPSNSVGKAIKDPYAGEALHEGYFNAKYQDRVKFTIMWENGASRAMNSADFRNNIVPFWIEYYFKNPNYLKIGNKPVISIYGLKGMMDDFGNSLTNVKDEIDYLRTACQAAGFSGAIVLTSYSGIDNTEMANRTTAGFDYIYSYGWGMDSINTSYQQSQLQAQRTANQINVIPSITVGRDDGAWGGYHNGTMRPVDFGNLLAWAKNTYMPLLPASSLGQTMILLGNWNEYGEGHFIAPSEQAGFEYLDAIRDNLGSGGVHTDTAPISSQRQRFSFLYPSTRFVERPGVNLINQPGFEGSVIKAGNWNALLTLTTAEKYHEWQSLQVQKTATYGSVHLPAQMRNNRTYYFSAWAKLAPSATAGTQRLTYCVEYKVGSASTTTQRIVGSSAPLTKTGWTQVSGTFTISEAAEISQTKAFLFTDNPALAETYYLDAVDLTLVGNLIADNADFEGPKSSGYQLWNADAGVSTEQAHSGAQSLKVQTTANYGAVYFPVQMRAKRLYTYSAWVRLAPGAAANQRIALGVEWRDASSPTTQQTVAVPSVIASTTGWTQITGSFAIPSDYPISRVRVFPFLSSPSNSGTYYIDDVDVR